MGAYDVLFDPLTVGPMKLRNRIVAPPMVQMRPITSVDGQAWYRRLAVGGAGLVIVEATGLPAFGDELTAEALAPLAQAIKQPGAAAGIQLFPLRFGEQADLNALGDDEIRAMLDGFARAAVVCRDAGFDIVEPHGAHGYLLNQFFMPDMNQRSDEWGGSDENRGRLAVRIVETIRAAVGTDLAIGYRHTPVGEAYGLEQSLDLAQRLVEAGADLLDISPAMNSTPADLAEPFKQRFPKTAIVAVKGMHQPDAAAGALAAGRCDLVAIGRQLIADNYWPEKVRAGRAHELVFCEECNSGCMGNIKHRKTVECVLWEEDELSAYRGAPR